jgi:hypothetical protein
MNYIGIYKIITYNSLYIYHINPPQASDTSSICGAFFFAYNIFFTIFVLRKNTYSMILQTMMPILIPMSHGHSGPWTANHTKAIIAFTLALGLCWLITAFFNYLAKRKYDYSFREIITPLGGHSGSWVATDILGLFFLVLAGIEIVFGISYGIYSIL